MLATVWLGKPRLEQDQIGVRLRVTRSRHTGRFARGLRQRRSQMNGCRPAMDTEPGL